MQVSNEDTSDLQWEVGLNCSILQLINFICPTNPDQVSGLAASPSWSSRAPEGAQPLDKQTATSSGSYVRRWELSRSARGAAGLRRPSVWFAEQMG